MDPGFAQLQARWSVPSRPLLIVQGRRLSAVPVAGPQLEHRERRLLSGEPPSPANPPSGCRFHPRCASAQTICSTQEPQLIDAGRRTLAACHFPISDEEAATILPGAGSAA
jgi:oligopeptide/dipeptide ABC transporter ATP-binding protein